jgi:3-oxoacyl-[acyl-carrier protein] reductase
MSDAKRLFGLRAVVTGAVGGIGEAIVRILVKQGAEVLAVDSANTNIETHFKSVRGVRGAIVDLQAVDAATRLADLAAEELGVVDIVVCNFNLQAEVPINDDDREALDKLVTRKNNLVVSIAEKFVPMMKSSPAGRIVIIGLNRSVFSQQGEKSYAEANASLGEVTARLAEKTAPFGINVNYIQLGSVMTPESRRVFNKDKALRDFCIRRSAARRLGEPVDVAKVALFLATDDSVFVSGCAVIADGGRSSGS